MSNNQSTILFFFTRHTFQTNLNEEDSPRCLEVLTDICKSIKKKQPHNLPPLFAIFYDVVHVDEMNSWKRQDDATQLPGLAFSIGFDDMLSGLVGALIAQLEL